jgi:multiple sugar transport system substrate-binding protein
MRDMVDEFNETHQNITVESNTLGWTDFYQRIVAAVHAGKGPDVAAMQLDNLATQAARSVIVPMEGAIAEMGLHAEDFPKTLVEATEFNGHVWGVPLDSHTIGSYANTDQLAKADENAQASTGPAFESQLASLQKAGIATPFWMPNQWPAHLMFLSLLWQNGGEPYSADGLKATYNSPEGVEALTWMVNQVKQGVSPTNVAKDSQYLAFKNGENAVTWDGIWQINDLEEAGTNYGIATLPVIGDELAAWANSHNFFMTKQAADETNRANAAKTFIGWMSDQSSAWSKAGMIPARNSARKEGAFTGSVQHGILDQVDHLHFLPPVPGLGDVQPKTLEVAVNTAVLGKQSPEASLSKAANNATELMKQNQQKFGA